MVPGSVAVAQDSSSISATSADRAATSAPISATTTSPAASVLAPRPATVTSTTTAATTAAESSATTGSPPAAPAIASSVAPFGNVFKASDAVLCLQEWEAQREAWHAARRDEADRLLHQLQLRARGALAALESWTAVLDSRRKLQEAAANAATKAMQDLEARWKPLRNEAIEGEAASWLLLAEKAHIEALAANARSWSSVAPAGAAALVQGLRQMVDLANGPVPEAVRVWHGAHEAVRSAWSHHSERLATAAKAEAEGTAPPDAWLSEVRYRELARVSLAEQASAATKLRNALQELDRLERTRAELWEEYAVGYRGAFQASGLEGDHYSDQGLPVHPTLALPPLAPASDQATTTSGLPDMPSAGGAVVHRLKVAMQAPSGLFGLGGNGWREGATLVLTLHGYLHLFYTDPPKGATVAKLEEEELSESALKASVYVPMATKCIFLQKGKELVLEVAEPEVAKASAAAAPGDVSGGAGAGGAVAGSSPPYPSSSPVGASQAEGGAAAAAAAAVPAGFSERASSGLRRLFGRPSGSEPLPRRVHAKMTALDDFRALETRCQGFVRRGQGQRAAAVAAANAA